MVMLKYATAHTKNDVPHVYIKMSREEKSAKLPHVDSVLFRP